MTKPKILFDASPMMDTQRSGVGYYVNSLFTSLGVHYSDKLDLTGYYFDFLNHGNKTSPSLTGIRFHKIWLTPGKLLSLCRRLGFQPFLELFTQKKSDIIIFTNYVSLPMVRKRRSILIIYDLSFLDHPEHLQSINLTYLQRFCAPSIRRADLIITISEFTKQRLLHHFPNLKADIVITPIPPARDVVNHRPLTKDLEATGIRRQKYFLYVGTIEPRKNIRNLVKAYALLPQVVRDEYSLVLAGGKGWKDEDILSEIKSQRANGAHIIQTGYVSDEEKDALYSNATCFVLPSHYEGFGMPILEAMQFGIPVAVSDIPVFHEVAGDAAAYFDKDDPQAIASTLNNVTTDKALRQKLRPAAKTQLKKISWSKNSRLTYEALVRLHSIR